MSMTNEEIRDIYFECVKTNSSEPNYLRFARAILSVNPPAVFRLTVLEDGKVAYRASFHADRDGVEVAYQRALDEQKERGGEIESLYKM